MVKKYGSRTTDDRCCSSFSNLNFYGCFTEAAFGTALKTDYGMMSLMGIDTSGTRHFDKNQQEVC
jgi:hypothetical protein